MATRSVSEILSNPLFKALMGDVAIVGGVQLLETMWRAQQRQKGLNVLAGGLDTTTTSSEPKPRPDLAKTLLELKDKDGKPDPDQIKKALDWIGTLQRAEKKKLETLTGEELALVLKLPNEIRTQYIDIVTGSTLEDEWEKFKQFLEDNLPKMTPSAQKKFDELKAWADTINNP